MHSNATKSRAVSLYHAGLSVRAVSRTLSSETGHYVSPQTIARWIGSLGLSRPVGEPRSVKLGPEAKRLYESGLTISQVARRFGVGKTTVGKRLRKMGTVIRPSGSRFLSTLNKERLRALYVRDRRSIKSIANETGCSQGTVYRLLRFHALRRHK